tara:strand:- start:1806 stop:1967 length:162 start_codon:yes stop_codon:yes gene_type:complete
LIAVGSACVRRYCGLGRAKLGRDLALRMPFFVAAIGPFVIVFYEILGLKITDD